MPKLLDSSELENSSIVANSLMNRSRKCFGGNSYEKELSFDILEFLKNRSKTQNQVRWLDICCGEGNALIEAANSLISENLYRNIKIIGIDLVGMFQKNSIDKNVLQLIEISFENYRTNHLFDLITCVHGLHYIGDKLEFLKKAAEFLKTDGSFFANLDISNLKIEDKKTSNRKILSELKNNGFECNSRKHLLMLNGKKDIRFNLHFVGADDRAGANYTGQAVVDSYYREIEK